MSIEHTNTIDLVSISPEKELVLTISDHLAWEDIDHLSILQDKINTYLAFMDSEQLLDMYPTAQQYPMVISVVLQFAPTKDAVAFLTEAKDVLREAGIGFRWEVVCGQ